jgi:hypothetical protein
MEGSHEDILELENLIAGDSGLLDRVLMPRVTKDGHGHLI